MSTRRQFLKQSSVLAAGAMLYKNSFAVNLLSKPKVVILGAGLSGLAAQHPRLGRRRSSRARRRNVQRGPEKTPAPGIAQRLLLRA